MDWDEELKDLARAMRDAGFQHVCTAERLVTRQDVEDYVRVLADARDEKPIQQFLAERPWMLTQQLGVDCRWLRSQPKLAERYVPDFMACRVDSTGPRWTLIELQSPSATLFTKKGRMSEQLDEGIRQIEDWRQFIIEEGAYLRSPTGGGYKGLTNRADGLILVGRAVQLTAEDRKRREEKSWNYRILIHSYDWLMREVIRHIEFRERYIASGEQWVCEECQTFSGI